MRGKDLIVATLFGGAGGGGGCGGGGGAVAVSPKEVNFYDYDGTCVHAYTVAEAQKLSELPAAPEHPGLVFQGWNWSLEDVKGLTRAMNIGAMYTTDDGTTRLYITLQEGRTSPMLGVGVNGTVTVDWGDGTEPDVLTGNNVENPVFTKNHAYASPGDYVIRLTVDGEMGIVGSNTSMVYCQLMLHKSTGDTMNYTYHGALRKIEIGDNVSTIYSAAFRDCYNLSTVSFPTAVKFSSPTYTFKDCAVLKHVNIPHGVTYVGNYAFDSCRNISGVVFPNSITKLSDYSFKSCQAMPHLTIPDGVADIPKSFLSFSYCLTKVFVPSSVKTIQSSSFDAAYGMACFDFTSHATVPTLASTSAFTGIPSDCEIRVPAALYDEWIAATNWATYASQIKAY